MTTTSITAQAEQKHEELLAYANLKDIELLEEWKQSAADEYISPKEWLSCLTRAEQRIKASAN